MKTLNYVKILLLCVFTIGLASCGDDVYYTMQNSDDKLCGKTWIEEYQTENKDGVEVLCSHQLKFAKADNSGQEIWEYYRGGESRPYETTSRTFTWKWMDKSMEGLTLIMVPVKSSTLIMYGCANIIYPVNWMEWLL